ncbi:MAG: TauD/TfdA family dioxygenase [Candidatus Zeuxoniibacter abyssi]|nr:MAG: TauD/TfdA family dioxygenase [Candidatus Persebacteraceae bacterium AB1(2)]
MIISDIALNENGKKMEAAWEDGHRASFHAIWLRDNCSCSECLHSNGQKLTNIVDLPTAINIASATFDDGGLHLVFAPDDHLSRFDAAWLRNFAAPTTPVQLWDTETLSVATLSRDYAKTHAIGLAEWLDLVVRYGCAVLRDSPREEGAVCKIAEWFGYVRETNYGRLFDVKAIANPNNLAYTGMALPVHTDNPYRDPPPGLQLLHCLHNAVAGGDSILVDGFMAAKILREEDKTHWQALSMNSVPFRFSDDSTDLRSRLPILDVAPNGDMRAVNFNNRSITALDIPDEDIPDYYAAYRHFAEILERPKLRLCFKLEDGDLFIVNNRRVLHGRESFKGGGTRHLQGCYADNDALLAKWRMLI